MELIKYSEKLLIWMHRENKTINWPATNLRQSRQLVSKKIKENSFNSFDKSTISSLGFKG
jgi:hypothetical protein